MPLPHNSLEDFATFQEALDFIQSKDKDKTLTKMDMKWRNNPLIVKAAIDKNSAHYRFASPFVRNDDKELALYAISKCADNLIEVNQAWKKDKEFLLEAVKRNCFIIVFIDEELKKDKDIIHCAYLENQLNNFKETPADYVDFLIASNAKESLPKLKNTLLKQDKKKEDINLLWNALVAIDKDEVSEKTKMNAYDFIMPLVSKTLLEQILYVVESEVVREVVQKEIFERGVFSIEQNKNTKLEVKKSRKIL